MLTSESGSPYFIKQVFLWRISKSCPYQASPEQLISEKQHINTGRHDEGRLTCTNSSTSVRRLNLLERACIFGVGSSAAPHVLTCAWAGSQLGCRCASGRHRCWKCPSPGNPFFPTKEDLPQRHLKAFNCPLLPSGHSSA